MGLDRIEIAAQLRGQIISGEYKTGEKLPGYRQLGRTFGAAPNTVGEAVRILAAEGLVSTRAGAAAVVQAPGEDAPEITAEGRLAEVHAELTDLRTEIRQIRANLTETEKRVANLLADLDGP